MASLERIGLVAALVAAGACATGSDSQKEDDAGGVGAAGGGGAAASVGVGGSSSCGTELDQEGCGCLVGDAPRQCYPGDAARAGKGACTFGTQTCEPDPSGETMTGTWQPCEGAGSPSPDKCDGTDSDCDGTIDTGCACMEGATQACSTACGAGNQTCTGGKWSPCDAPQPNPDNSCPCVDGTSQSCLTPNGDTGVQTCVGGQWGPCIGSMCIPNAPAPGPWEAYAFTSYAATTPCAGARYVRFFPAYNLWVGAILCSATQYKLFLGATKDAMYYQIGDYAGNGQDHCELVNGAFTIPNEDDITSGGCASCAVGPITWSDPSLGPGYSRAHFGDCFAFEPMWPQFNLHSTQWYECGVAIP